MHFDSFSFYDRGYLLYITRSLHLWNRMDQKSRTSVAYFTLQNFPRDYLLNHYDETIRIDLLFIIVENDHSIPEAFFKDFPFKIFESPHSTLLARLLHQHPSFIKQLLQVPERPCCVDFWYSDDVRNNVWFDQFYEYDETHRQEISLRSRVKVSSYWRDDEFPLTKLTDRIQMVCTWMQGRHFDPLVKALDKWNYNRDDLLYFASDTGFFEFSNYLVRRYPESFHVSQWLRIFESTSLATFELYVKHLPSVDYILKEIAPSPQKYMRIFPIILKRLSYAILLGPTEPPIEQVQDNPELHPYLLLESARKGWNKTARFIIQSSGGMSRGLKYQALEYAVAARNWVIIKLIRVRVSWTLMSRLFSEGAVFWLEGFHFFSKDLPSIENVDPTLELFQKVPSICCIDQWSISQQVEYCITYLKNAGNPFHLPKLSIETLNALSVRLSKRRRQPLLGTFDIWNTLFNRN